MIFTADESHTCGSNELHLPRILCLHGGGVNAAIFKLQCRVLAAQLKDTFRLCFVDGPYESEPGPGILPTYAGRGPYRRWLRWKPEQPHSDAETIIKDIDLCIEAAMAKDTQAGATGEWVGLLGFSQGAKVCGSLLLRQQARSRSELGKDNTSFRFAVLMAGRGPLIALDPDLLTSPTLADANELTTGAPRPLTGVSEHDSEHILRLPTLHIHGLQDPGIRLHQQLYEHFCWKDSRNLVQWDGNHRVPIRSCDIAKIVRKMLDIAREVQAVPV